MTTVQSDVPPPSRLANISLDIPTIMAIGIVVFIIKNLIHEALGHGGACLLIGGKPLTLTTAHFDYDAFSVSNAGVRFIAAGGFLANFVAAGIFLFLFRRFRTQSPRLRYFFWLSMSGNFFVGAGYPLFSGMLGIGDLVDVVQGYEPAWAWRALLVLSGLLLYGFGVWMSLREIVTLIGSHPVQRLKNAFTLTLFPYLAGATVASIGSWLNPLGAFVIFTSAAASFGGSSAFAWMSQLLKNATWFPQQSDSSVSIERRTGWIIAAVILAALHIFVLGPGIHF